MYEAFQINSIPQREAGSIPKPDARPILQKLRPFPK